MASAKVELWSTSCCNLFTFDRPFLSSSLLLLLVLLLILYLTVRIVCVCVCDRNGKPTMASTAIALSCLFLNKSRRDAEKKNCTSMLEYHHNKVLVYEGDYGDGRIGLCG